MTTITLQEAQAHLSEIIHRLTPGEEVTILEGKQVVARLVASHRPMTKRTLGTMRGTVIYMAPDFDAPLKEFTEYME
jgi:antitoxin (DNA-binding transcriptional repressor) of toxin-antitoxin stability system